LEIGFQKDFADSFQGGLSSKSSLLKDALPKRSLWKPEFASKVGEYPQIKLDNKRNLVILYADVGI